MKHLLLVILLSVTIYLPIVRNDPTIGDSVVWPTPGETEQ